MITPRTDRQGGGPNWQWLPQKPKGGHSTSLGIRHLGTGLSCMLPRVQPSNIRAGPSWPCKGPQVASTRCVIAFEVGRRQHKDRQRAIFWIIALTRCNRLQARGDMFGMFRASAASNTMAIHNNEDGPRPRLMRQDWWRLHVSGTRVSSPDRRRQRRVVGPHPHLPYPIRCRVWNGDGQKFSSGHVPVWYVGPQGLQLLGIICLS